MAFMKYSIFDGFSQFFNMQLLYVGIQQAKCFFDTLCVFNDRVQDFRRL